MAFITGNGAPNRNMRCSVGDKYIDSETGNSYICTFTYHDSMNNATCEWKNLPGVDFQKNKTERREDLPKNDDEVRAEDLPKGNIERGEVKTEDSPKDKSSNPSGVTIQMSTKPKYNDYSKQYKKNRN